MNSFWNYILAIILFIIWIIAGGFLTQSNVFLRAYRHDDQYMHAAWVYTLAAALVTWILIFIFIVLFILAIVGVVALFGSGVGEVGIASQGLAGGQIPIDSNMLGTGISWLGIAALVFALILVFINGILAALAAEQMVKSPNYTSNNERLKKAYDNCKIAAIMSLLAASLLIIGLITYIIIKQRIEAKNRKIIEDFSRKRNEELELKREIAGQLLLRQISSQ